VTKETCSVGFYSVAMVVQQNTGTQLLCWCRSLWLRVPLLFILLTTLDVLMTDVLPLAL
jgi:hypothetical protein